MFKHISVLLNESIEMLNIKPDGIYVDATLGGGGHSSEILKRLGKNGHLYCFDKDVAAIDHAAKILSQINTNFTLIHSDYKNIKGELNKLNVEKVDGIIFDIGVSSYQFDSVERGFSYNNDARLDMRMDTLQKLSAYQVVNNYPYEKLVKIFYEYGEESFAKPIAKNICEKRQDKPIETTLQLVEVIKKTLPNKIKSQKGHPAKKVFQAIRIEVNDELNSLHLALKDALELLNHQARIAVISFHSLEDRIVKTLFNNSCKENDEVKGLVNLNSRPVEYGLVNKKPILASNEEVENNNRAHSAKLRVIEKI